MTTATAKPVSDLLTKTRDRAAQRQASNDDQYRKLVRAAAEGKELDPDRVLKELDRFGRDPADFQEDVETVCHRSELRALVAALPSMLKECDAAEAAIFAAYETRAADAIAADEKYARAYHPANQKVAELTAKIAAARDAQNHLLHACPDEETKERVDALQGALQAADQELRQLEHYRQGYAHLIADARVRSTASEIPIQSLKAIGEPLERYRLTTEQQEAKSQLDALLERQKGNNAALEKAKARRDAIYAELPAVQKQARDA
jgi:hypothetical protein